MPCRRGCPPTPTPPTGPPQLVHVQCRCGRRGWPSPPPRPRSRGSLGWRRMRDNVFCTTDTCANPQFCITFKPEFCPNVVAVTPQEDWSYHADNRSGSPSFQEARPPWLPNMATNSQHFTHPPYFSHSKHHAYSPHFADPPYSPPPSHSPHPPQSPYSPHIPHHHNQYFTYPQHSPTPSQHSILFNPCSSSGSQQSAYTTRTTDTPDENKTTYRAFSHPPCAPPPSPPQSPLSPHIPHQHNSHFIYPQHSPTPSQHSVHFNPRSSSGSQQPSYSTRTTDTPAENKSTTQHLGRPSTTLDKSHGYFCENPRPEQSGGRDNLGGSSYPITRVPSPGAERGARGQRPCGQQRRSWIAQPISPGLQCSQQSQRSTPFESNMAGAGGGTGGSGGEVCACRMPPAYAHLRCTGNLDGFCNCTGCKHNK